MKQSIFKWLSCSLILLIILSCKKEKGALDDFDPGKFDYTCILEQNGVQDTLIGELSGPYLQGGNYVFRVRKQLEPSINTFRIGTYQDFKLFNMPELGLAGAVTSSEHDSDHLWVIFYKESTVSGSFTLTRKQ